MAKNREPLLWKRSFETGVQEIDEQHKILVHTLNEASEKLSADGSLELLDEITQSLLSYALYHFETEEELMQRYGYRDDAAEDADNHLAQHRGFSAKVVDVREGLMAGTPVAPAELLGFLNQWLVNHILNTDKKLGAHILKKRGSAPAG